MACKIANRKYVRLPGLVAEAIELGVTYSHLRRCVIGERISRRLMASYEALKAAPEAAQDFHSEAEADAPPASRTGEPVRLMASGEDSVSIRQSEAPRSGRPGQPGRLAGPKHQ